MEVNERIKQRRKQLGLSAEQVAEIIGVSPATIYRYESKDIANMGIDKIAPIADALNCSPAYLMGWNNNEVSENESKLNLRLTTYASRFNKLSEEGRQYIEKQLEIAEKMYSAEPIAAHNDADQTEEELRLMQKDIDEL